MKERNDINVDIWGTDFHNGLFFSRTRYQKFHFDKHFHNYYTVILVENGVNEGFTERLKYKIGRGSVLIINPGEIHAGNSFRKRNLKFNSLTFDIKFMNYICNLLQIESNCDVIFNNAPIQDGVLVSILDNLFLESKQKSDSNNIPYFLLVLFDYLLANFWSDKKRKKKHATKLYLERAMEYIVANHKNSFSLSQLSESANVSEYHLLREFKKELKVTPFQFLRNYRIEQSKNYLTREAKIVKVALDMGFFDHSHFTRSFYKSTGILPSDFKAMKPKAFGF